MVAAPGEERAMSGIEIREVTTEDAGAVYALACELADAVGDSPPDEEAVRERLKELLETPQAHTLVAEDEKEVVGVISIWIKPDLAHGDTVVEMPMLVVSKKNRRSGVGKLLVEEARERASEYGARLIELVATYDNAVARDFYRSLGFVETEHLSLEFMGDLEDPPQSEEE